MMQRIEYYSDFRTFLRDLFEERKKSFPFFSNRYFCQKAGVKSPSLFKEIVEGKRNLTEKTIAAFAKGFSLNENDTKFFTLLVHFNQSKEPAAKQQLLEQMRGLARKVDQEVVPTDHYAYYAKWYNPVIRELACLFNWHEDYALLARTVTPPIKKNEAKESVALLLKLGFLVKAENGVYAQHSPAITTGREVASIGVRSLNRHLSQMGTDAIDRFPPSERDISSVTIGIAEKSYRLIKQEIQEFKNRIIRIVDDEAEPKQVYNINIQLFPLSAEPEQKEGTDETW